MEKFLKQIEPIIKSKIRKYRPYIKNYEWEDLMQEGYLAALKAANRWKIDTDKAGLIAWTWIHIDSKFKELSMKSNGREVYFEELNFEITQEDVHLVWGQSQSSPEQDEAREKIVELLIKSIPKFECFLERALDENLTGTAVAKKLGLTKQRISQLKNEVVRTISAPPAFPDNT